ncbi:MAG: uroporphyrinogen-III C-methyltransferase [Chloroflexi bacterium]|nr:uroporphyrinogen-III C-methyltransferase [Chloroflexota bacterium]
MIDVRVDRSRGRGRVVLVGAGPGDPGLLTVRGRRRLRRADVVVYDELVDRRLLDLAPPDACRIYVGKMSGRHVTEQDVINRLLVDHARLGRRVVRLKGGDPFVFGRGGEEVEALVAAGIAVEVVPGVSSAVAVPAAAGIPLTHRRLAASFAVVTGHECARATGPRVDWARLAGAVDTLVILMGLASLPRIARKLAAAGRPPDTPVAVVHAGTTRDQVTLTGSLADIAVRAASARLRAPVVIVVGDVVALRDQLGWTDRLWHRARRSRRPRVALVAPATRAGVTAKEDNR